MYTLDLVLMGKWYDMIESGVKTEEYRENKPYWRNRLLWKQYEYGIPKYQYKPYTHVRFRRGYTSISMLYEIKEITIGEGKQEWGAPIGWCFIIKLGTRIQ